jgi:peptidoglycan-N-acetylglucosamine deacetylase
VRKKIPQISIQHLPNLKAGKYKAVSGKPAMSLSFDLDNLWSYQKTHGDPGWNTFPTYLDVLAETCLPVFKRHTLKMTVFIVGQDAALSQNRNALQALSTTGHEIGNHSFRHEPWLHLYSPDELRREFDNAEESIEKATGKLPVGFRGPGFSLSNDVLRELSRRRYLYDASTLPTFLGPLARAYYFWSSKGISKPEKQKRKQLFGKFSEGFRPIRPYCWRTGEHQFPLVEIPVTTIPIIRTPMHLSYIGYLAGHSLLLARMYLKLAVGLCRIAGVSPSFLLHPLDFLGADKVKELSFFPGMQLTTEFKLRLFDEVITYFKRFFELIPMEQHARALLAEIPKDSL